MKNIRPPDAALAPADGGRRLAGSEEGSQWTRVEWTREGGGGVSTRKPGTDWPRGGRASDGGPLERRFLFLRQRVPFCIEVSESTRYPFASRVAERSPLNRLQPRCPAFTSPRSRRRGSRRQQATPLSGWACAGAPGSGSREAEVPPLAPSPQRPEQRGRNASDPRALQSPP